VPIPLKRLEEKLREIGHSIAGQLPRGAGFLLVLYDFGGTGSMTYLSNGDRADCVRMLGELLEKMQAEQS